MLEFKPPRPNSILIFVFQMLIDPWLFFSKKLAIKFLADRDRLIESLHRKRVVILCNHPDMKDPLVICMLSKFLSQHLYCVAAREVFDWNHGLRGWLFQRLGAYSVVRGKVDIESIETTKELLLNGRNKLVIFPEAEVTSDDSKLHPMQEGIIHLLLDVQDQLVNRKFVEPALFILPMTIRYSVEPESLEELRRVMSVLETKLAEKPEHVLELPERLVRLVTKFTQSLADQYSIVPAEPDLKARVDKLIKDLLNHVGQSAGVTLSEFESDTAPEVMHRLRVDISKKIDGDVRVRAQFNAFERKLSNRLLPSYRSLLSTLDTVERLLIIHRALKQPLSLLQSRRILECLELEIMDSSSSKGWLNAEVRFGDLVNVQSFLPHYLQSKALAVKRLSNRIKHEMDFGTRSEQGTPGTKLRLPART